MIIQHNIPVPPEPEEIEKIIKEIMDKKKPPEPPTKIQQVEVKIPQKEVQIKEVIKEVPVEVVKTVKQEDYLGKAYQYLYGQKNYYEAIKLFEALDAKSEYNATCTLGIMYMDGLGVTKDISKAVTYF